MLISAFFGTVQYSHREHLKGLCDDQYSLCVDQYSLCVDQYSLCVDQYSKLYEYWSTHNEYWSTQSPFKCSLCEYCTVPKNAGAGYSKITYERALRAVK